MLTRLDRLLACRAITSAEWHAAADYRELVDQVRRGALVCSSSLVRVVGSVFPNWVAGDLDASARLRQICAALGDWVCNLLEAAAIKTLRTL